MTSISLVESCWLAELSTIDTGKELQSTATCIFVPEILLNPSYPVTSPLFWQELMTSQRTSFAIVAYQRNVQILLHQTEYFSRCCFVAMFVIYGVQ